MTTITRIVVRHRPDGSFQATAYNDRYMYVTTESGATKHEAVSEVQRVASQVLGYPLAENLSIEDYSRPAKIGPDKFN